MTDGTNGSGGNLILIVEDSLTQAEQLRALLEKRGYRVLHAIDGEQALREARERKPDLVISDIVMPKMDGYELCRRLKADDRLADVPVMLVTTLADSQDVIRGLACGADNFLRKPYEERYLLSRLDYLLMNRVLRKEQRMQMGVEINLAGRRYFINSERQQILDLLISTYEQAVDLNSELSRRQAELSRANRVLEGLYQLSQGLNRATSTVAVAEVALDRLLRLPGINGGWVGLFSENEQLEIVALRNMPAGVEAASFGSSRDAGGDGDHGGLLFEPLRAGDENVLVARVPLRLGSRELGELNLVSRNAEAPMEGTLKGIQGVGNQVSVALERARLHERLEQLVEERTSALREEVIERKRHEDRVVRLNRLYSFLSGINTTIVHSQNRDELFRRACEIAVELGGFRFAWIGMIQGQRQHPQLVAQAGGSEALLELVEFITDQGPQEGADVLTMALESKRAIICNDIAADERFVWRDEALRHDCRSLVVLPLTLDDQPAGTFTLCSAEPNVFDDEEMRLLDEVAGDISFALGHLRKGDRLHELAFYDEVTRLPNRSLALERLRAKIEARAEGECIVVALIDLVRFKTVNESLGHNIGNLFLHSVGDRLQSLLGAETTVARVAGDEFALLLPGLDQPADGARIARQVVEGLSEPFRVKGYDLFTGGSIGLAIYPDHGDRPEALLESAELAMYRAKRDGGNSYRFYSSEMGSEADTRLSLETALRRAFEEDEFLLHYQPVFDLESNEIVGFEALVRWQYKKGKLMPPDEFIPIAEETGLIVPLGEWVLRTACEQGKRWSAALPTTPRMKVNLSPRQFRQQSLSHKVNTILCETGFDPVKLTLEITENQLMQDVETALEVMGELGQLGVEFSIDDFGTGYSSMAYLSRLPIDRLKIDRSFVNKLPASEREATLVTAMITLGQKMGLGVVAEGIETKEQLDFLRAQGCDAGQGYYFGRPMPAEEIEREFLFVTTTGEQKGN